MDLKKVMGASAYHHLQTQIKKDRIQPETIEMAVVELSWLTYNLGMEDAILTENEGKWDYQTEQEHRKHMEALRVLIEIKTNKYKEKLEEQKCKQNL